MRARACVLALGLACAACGGAMPAPLGLMCPKASLPTATARVENAAPREPRDVRVARATALLDDERAAEAEAILGALAAEDPSDAIVASLLELALAETREARLAEENGASKLPVVELAAFKEPASERIPPRTPSLLAIVETRLGTTPIPRKLRIALATSDAPPAKMLPVYRGLPLVAAGDGLLTYADPWREIWMTHDADHVTSIFAPRKASRPEAASPRQVLFVELAGSALYVLFGSAGGVLAKFDAQSGACAWAKRVTDTWPAYTRFVVAPSGVAVARELGGNGDVLLLDAATGALRSRTPIGACSPAAMRLEGAKIAVSCEASTIVLEGPPSRD